MINHPLIGPAYTGETTYKPQSGAAAGTLIHTNDGAVPIEQVSAHRHKVLAADGVYRPILRVIEHSGHKEPLFDLRLKHASGLLTLTGGTQINVVKGVPMEQPIRRTMAGLKKGTWNEGWVRPQQLDVGDYVGMPIPTRISDVQRLSEDHAWLYAVMLGDGHVSRGRNEAGVSCHIENKRTVLDKVRGILNQSGVHYWENFLHGSCLHIKWTHLEEVFGFGREHLYDHDDNKRIHAEFMDLPRSKNLRIIEGLLRTDGNISRISECTFSTSSAPLGEGLRYQLLRLGVPSHAYCRWRQMGHIATRSNGSEAVFTGPSFEMKVAVPMIAELATVMGTPALTKFNWFVHNGKVYSRLKSVNRAQCSGAVFQIVAAGDASFATVNGLIRG